MAARPPERSTPEASSAKPPEFKASKNDNCCADEDGASARQCCVEAGSKTGVSNLESSLCFDQPFHKVERLQKPETESSKRKSRRSDGAGKRCDYASDCNCAASFAGDCAAVCCCPCVIVHLLILALVKLPFAIARKAFFRAKKMGPLNKKSDNRKKNTDENDDDDEKSENSRVLSPPWCYRESPQMTEAPQGLRSPKFDYHKLWSELYASGHMGFGGVLWGPSS